MFFLLLAAHALNSAASEQAFSSCTITSGEQEKLNVKAVAMETRPVEGCLLQDRHSGPSFKYVVVFNCGIS